MNPFKNQRIDRVFFGSFAFVISILLSMVIWIAYVYSTGEIAANTSIHQKALLQELNEQLALQMQAVEQTSLAASREIGGLSALVSQEGEYERIMASQYAESLLRNVAHSNSGVQAIQLFAEGVSPTEELAEVRFNTLKDMEGMDWLSGIYTSDFLWAGNHRLSSYQGPVPVISFARKIYGVTGDLMGVLILHMKAQVFLGILEGTEKEARERVLLDAGGRTIIATGPFTSRGIPPSGLFHMSAEDPAADSGFRRIPGEQAEMLLVWAKSYSSGWTLYETTPWESLSKGSVRMAKAILLSGGIALLLALGVTLFLSGQFAKPIRLVVTAMSRFDADRPDMRLPEDYSNEFGSLFGGYRMLAGRVRELLVSLEHQFKRQKEAEISALQAMINPHFLYNSLDQLNWLALDEGNEKISTILEKMGRMFRIGLSRGESFIRISEELEFLRCYAEIQEILWEGKLSVLFDLEEDLMTLYIPKLTLQPFLENAVKHGFHGRECGAVRISGRKAGQAVMFVVQDDGRGFQPDKTVSDGEVYGGGYGLKNVAERLEAFFGAGYGYEIESEPGAGTRVTVRIPVLPQKP